MNKPLYTIYADELGIDDSNIIKQDSYDRMIGIQVDSDSRIRSLTQKFTEEFGWSHKDLFGKNLHTILNPQYSIKERQSEINIVLAQENTTEPYYSVLLSKSGQRINMRFVILRSSLPDNDTSVHILIGNRELQPEEHEPELADNKAMIGEYLEHAEDLIIVLDKNKIIKSANKVWGNKLGYEVIPKKGKALETILNPITKEQTLKLLESLSINKLQTNFSIVLMSKNTDREIFFTGNASCFIQNKKIYEYRLVLKDISEQIRTEKAKNLYYAIAHHTIQNHTPAELYQNIYKELNKVIDCDNFFIALYDPQARPKTVSFPFILEIARNLRGSEERVAGKGLTEYTTTLGKPLMLYQSDIEALIKSGDIEVRGMLPKIWIGIPLKTAHRIIGIISVQAYDNESKYTDRDLRLLDFASSQIALSIDMLVTQEELKSQTARLNALFESSSHLIWTVNKDLELTSYNKNYFDAIFSIYDISSDTPQDSLPKVLPLDTFWDKKYEAAFKGEQVHFEIKLKNVNGDKFWKEIYLSPIHVDGQDIEEVSGLANDITESKQAEQAIIDSEEKFRTIFESFQDVFYHCDVKGKILMVSPSIYDLTGYNTEEVEGKNFTDFYKTEHSLDQLIAKLIKTPRIKNVSALLQTKDGITIECLCNLRLIVEHDKPIAFEAVIRDISEISEINRELRSAKETAEQSLLVKEQFLANMSHEIRTPMNGVIGMIDLLMNSSLNTEQQAYMNTIRNSSETLLHILNEILDISKMEAGKLGIKNEPFSLAQTLIKVKALFSPKASTSMVSLNVHISKALPAIIEADQTRVIQVLSNLISNAIKFTERRGSVDVSVDVIQKKGRILLIKVDIKDSGIGIDKEDQQKLFTSFSQLDNSTTKQHSGTGLGLAISKKLVILMGGEIGLVSHPGLGSTFWFTFKARIAKQGTVITPEPIVDESFKIHRNIFEGHSPKVLVVDDNLVNRDVAGEILKKAGCRVDLASDGLEAVFKAKRIKYDIIFMDIQMPDLDGIEASKQIRSNSAHKPWIIAMTAYSLEKDKRKFKDKGMDDYLAKPIRAKNLIDKVRKYLHLMIEPEKVILVPANDEMIDKSVIDQLKKYGGADMVSNAFSEFQQETSEVLESCKKALKRKDYQCIQQYMHMLKGTSGTLGINIIASQSIKIELALNSLKYESMETDLLELCDRFAQFRENFTNIIR